VALPVPYAIHQRCTIVTEYITLAFTAVHIFVGITVIDFFNEENTYRAALQPGIYLRRFSICKGTIKPPSR
jgi:hypothetical protein